MEASFVKRTTRNTPHQVEERTRELEEQKKLLSTQASELYRQNQLLKQQNAKNNQTKRATDPNVKKGAGIDG